MSCAAIPVRSGHAGRPDPVRTGHIGPARTAGGTTARPDRRQRADMETALEATGGRAAARSGTGPGPTLAAAIDVRSGPRGFTLLEIMITVAVVAIVAAIALPSYNDYVMRGKIVEATSSLAEMRTRLEQHFADNRQYPTACIAPAPGPAPTGKIYLPGASKFFAVSCALTATTYTVTATGDATQGMAGFAYTIDERNNRRTTALPDGWSGAGASSTCWVNRKSGTC
jgi:type IV pilus assembly protein PilE